MTDRRSLLKTALAASGLILLHKPGLSTLANDNSLIVIKDQ